MTKTTSLGALLTAILLSVAANAFAASFEFTVSETAGLRRFGYPVTASLSLPQGTLADIASARLVNAAGKELSAQFTSMTRWPDGSVHQLDVDFTSSIGPMETELYRFETSGGKPRSGKGGLAVTESQDEITVASSAIAHKIRRDGKPLISSIACGKTEYLSTEGITTSQPVGAVEILKRGPFNVTLRVGPVFLEYVSSKSWVKISQHTNAPTELIVDARFALPESPVLWDMGVESWLYGHFRKPTETASFSQHASGWRMLTGTKQPTSLYASGRRSEGWGHLADKQRVIAFGMADFSADGDPSFRFGADGNFRASANRKDLTVYFHVVGQPVQVTALTSPPSMLAPLVVKPK